MAVFGPAHLRTRVTLPSAEMPEQLHNARCPRSTTPEREAIQVCTVLYMSASHLHVRRMIIFDASR